MKFVTTEIYEDEGMESMSEACHAYALHLASLKEILPTSIIELSSQDLLDDGLIVQVLHDQSLNQLILTLPCGNLQIDYYDLIITYNDTLIGSESELTLMHIARSCEQHEVFWHELDFMRERLVHSIMFRPGIWFAVNCASIHWQQISKPSRQLPDIQDRYSSC